MITTVVALEVGPLRGGSLRGTDGFSQDCDHPVGVAATDGLL